METSNSNIKIFIFAAIFFIISTFAITEGRLQSDCEEENAQLKEEILAIQKASNAKTEEIKRLERTIQDMTRAHMRVKRQGGLPACEANLSSQLALLAACQTNASSLQTQLNTCSGQLTNCRGSLSDCISSNSSCYGQLSACTAASGTCTASLQICNNNASACNALLSACVANNNTCYSQLATCNTNFLNCTALYATCIANANSCGNNLLICRFNLTSCSTNLITCSNNLSSCQTLLISCNGNSGSGSNLCLRLAGLTLRTLPTGKYYFSQFQLSWIEAKAFCRSHGMSLVAIDSDNERNVLSDYLTQFFGNDMIFWTGGLLGGQRRVLSSGERTDELSLEKSTEEEPQAAARHIPGIGSALNVLNSWTGNSNGGCMAFFHLMKFGALNLNSRACDSSGHFICKAPSFC